MLLTDLIKRINEYSTDYNSWLMRKVEENNKLKKRELKPRSDKKKIFK